MSCLGEATVLGWLDNRLSKQAREAAQAHAIECPECLELVAASRLLRSQETQDRGGRAPAVCLEVGATRMSCDERYELGREIGRGGMGRVFEAKDQALGRTIAVKMVRNPSSGHVVRFRSEVAIASMMQHPSIIPVYDAGVFGDGSAFCAMRLVRGESLHDAISSRKSVRERLGLLPAMIQVADAIAYAHSRGVIHRDIKPQNILLGPFGETVVLDWGLAKVQASEDPDDEISELLVESGETLVGQVLGTPGYMAPEQETGLGADERSDVFAMGVVLGEVVFGANYRELDYEKLPLRLAPRDLVAIAERATQAEPELRYASVQHLADDLKRFSTGQLVSAQKYSYVALLGRWAKRRRGLVAAGVMATALVVGAIVSGSLIEDAKRSAPQTVVDSPEGELMKSFLGMANGTAREAKLSEQRAATQVLSIATPDDQSREELAISHEALGDTLFRDILGRKEHDAALVEYRSALAIWESLVDAAPEDPTHWGGLARMQTSIADVFYDRFELVAALAEYRRAFRSSSRHAELDNGLRVLATRETTAASVARLEYEAGDPSSALAFWMERVVSLRRAVASGQLGDPEVDLSRALGKAAEVHIAVGAAKQARSLLSESFALEEAEGYVTNEWKRSLAGQHLAYGRLLKVAGAEFADAKAHFKTCASLINDFGHNANDAFDLACCGALAGESDIAIAALLKALDGRWHNTLALEQHADLTSLHSDPRWRSLLARMYEARPK